MIEEMTLIELYRYCCNEYIELFVKKQGIKFDYWIGATGEVAAFCDQYFFSINEIIYDIENNCEAGLICQWQDDGVEFSKDCHHMNYNSYVKGMRYSDI